MPKGPRVALRGSFDDVVNAFAELRRIINDPKVPWTEIEDQLDRAFCGFMPPELERLLRLVRVLGCQDLPYFRRKVALAVENARSLALESTFRLSQERYVSKIWEE